MTTDNTTAANRIQPTTPQELAKAHVEPIDWLDLSEHFIKNASGMFSRYRGNGNNIYGLVADIMRSLHNNYGWRHRGEVSAIAFSQYARTVEIKRLKELLAGTEKSVADLKAQLVACMDECAEKLKAKDDEIKNLKATALYPIKIEKNIPVDGAWLVYSPHDGTWYNDYRDKNEYDVTPFMDQTPDPTMTQILELGSILARLSKEKKAYEDAIDSLNEKIEKIQGDLLPTLMDGLNPPMKEVLVTVDGEDVRITRFDLVKAKILPENKDAAFIWLEKTKNDALIKNCIEIQFGRGDKENDNAEAITELAEEVGGSVKREQTIHYKTLESFVKKQIEDGDLDPENPFPRNLFGVVEIKRVKIK